MKLTCVLQLKTSMFPIEININSDNRSCISTEEFGCTIENEWQCFAVLDLFKKI